MVTFNINCYAYIPTIMETTLNCVCMEYGVKNTFGILVYSKEYIFSILFYLFHSLTRYGITDDLTGTYNRHLVYLTF
jgi:hypothetical protein